MPDQVDADLADTGDAHAAARQRRRTPEVLGAGPHALEHPERGEHGGVTSAPLASDRPVAQRVSSATTSMSAT